MVASTGMTSACLSSLILGSFMCTLVIFCRKFALNPGERIIVLSTVNRLSCFNLDNIAPPIAACLGDLVTLSLLGLVSTFLINYVNTPLPLVFGIITVVSACFCAYIVSRNQHVRSLIKQGWTPLFAAMAISSATGIILDVFVSRYSGFALLAVIISGTWSSSMKISCRLKYLHRPPWSGWIDCHFSHFNRIACSCYDDVTRFSH